MFALVSFTAVKAGSSPTTTSTWRPSSDDARRLHRVLRLPPRQPLRYAALAATAGIAVAGFTPHFPGYPLTNPIENAANGAGTVARIVGPGRLGQTRSHGGSAEAALYGVDSTADLDLLTGHTVHVDPSEAAAAWAYDLDWLPLPVFQPYVAWTTDLDDRNAEVVASRDGPDRILRQNLNVLGRYPGYESPAAMLECCATSASCARPRAGRSSAASATAAAIPSRSASLRRRTASRSLSREPPRDSVVFARVRGAQLHGARTTADDARPRSRPRGQLRDGRREPASEMVSTPFGRRLRARSRHRLRRADHAGRAGRRLSRALRAGPRRRNGHLPDQWRRRRRPSASISSAMPVRPPGLREVSAADDRRRHPGDRRPHHPRALPRWRSARRPARRTS